MINWFGGLKRVALAAAAALSLLAAGPVCATTLHPYYTSADKTFHFDSIPGNVTMVFSTYSTFSPYVSSATAVAVSTVAPSVCNSQTCYFMVKVSTEDDSYFEQFSTANYDAPGTPYFPWVQSTLVLISWSVGTNPSFAEYEVNVATENAFVEPLPSSTTYRYNGSVIISPLLPNTLYYTRARSKNADKTYSAFSSIVSTMTATVENETLSVDVTSVSIAATYTTLPVSPPSASCSGYALKVGDREDFSGVNVSSQTEEVLLDTLKLEGLSQNTTYFYALGPKNAIGNISFAAAEAFVTKTVPISGFAISQLYHSSTAFTWGALPSSPKTSTSEGYRVDVSTASDFSVIVSSITSSVAQSTLAPQGLMANTSYYARAGALNWAGDAQYVTSGENIEFMTLSLPLDLNLITSSATGHSVTVNWSPLEASPQSVSCEGYIVQASPNSDFSAPVYFSSTTSNSANRLTVSGLYPNLTYHIRVGTINRAGQANYVRPPAMKTTDGPSLTGLVVTSTGTNSVRFSWTANPDMVYMSNGFVAQASQMADFSVISASVTTTDTSTSSILLNGSLIANTSYFMRVGVSYGELSSATTVYSIPTNAARVSMLAQPLTAVSISGVFHSSVAVSWTTRPATPNSLTAEGYLVRVSTASDMSGIVYSSNTIRLAVSTLTVSYDSGHVNPMMPNTLYYARAGTYNWDYVANEVAAPASFVTRANPPVPQAATDVDNQSIRFNWLPNSNPAGTVYRCELSTSTGFENLVGASSDTVATSILYTGLDSNTTFYLRIKARNSVSDEEPAVLFPGVPTLAIPPTPRAYTNIQAYGFRANWDPAGNGPTTVYQVQVSTDGLYNTLSASGESTTSYYVLSTLSGNMLYYSRVRGVSSGGSPTGWADLGSVLTMPATPTDGNPNFSNIMLDAFTASWNANGNSAGTVYQVQISSFSDYSVLAASASLTAVTNTFTNLSQETSYYARVRAAPNASLADPAYHSLGIAFTPRYGVGDILYSNGGIATLPATYGVIKVSGPPQSFRSNVTITIERNFNMPAGSSMATPMTPTGVGVNVTPLPKFQPEKTLTIVIPYRPQDMVGFDRSRLIIAYYNTDGDAWVPLPSVSDVSNNLVTAQVTHLSTFQIMQSNPSQALGDIKIFPNPFRPSRHNFMQFANMPSGARVRLFTMLGELVAEFSADYSGNALWDGKNKYGSKVASGVFIVLIEGDGVGKHITKLAVER